jgi:hypothetical protein
VVQFDVEPVRRAIGDLRDPVALLEAEEQLLAGVVHGVELIDPEQHRRRLVAGDEQQSHFDVVRAAELVAFAELELPVLARRDPVLEGRDVDAERLVDLDVDRRVGPLRRCRAWLDGQSGDVSAVPA